MPDGYKREGLIHVGEILPRLAAIEKLAAEALAVELEDAKEAGALGFMARALVQATMPHSSPEESYFERTNGAFTLTCRCRRTSRSRGSRSLGGKGSSGRQLASLRRTP
jgi:hypothetical protein